MDNLTFREKFPELNDIQRKWILRDLEKMVYKYIGDKKTAYNLSTAVKNYIEGEIDGKNALRPTNPSGMPSIPSNGSML